MLLLENNYYQYNNNYSHFKFSRWRFCRSFWARMELNPLKSRVPFCNTCGNHKQSSSHRIFRKLAAQVGMQNSHKLQAQLHAACPKFHGTFVELQVQFHMQRTTPALPWMFYRTHGAIQCVLHRTILATLPLTLSMPKI